MEESLAAEGTAGRGRPPSCGRSSAWSRAPTSCSLALVDGSVPATARRAVLDHLLERAGADRGPLPDPSGRLRGAGGRRGGHLPLAGLADRRCWPTAASTRPPTPVTTSCWAGWAPATGCWATPPPSTSRQTVAQLEEIEDQLFRFARTVESNRALRDGAGRPGPAGVGPPVGGRRPPERPGAARHRPGGGLRRAGRPGPRHRRRPSTPWWRTPPAPVGGAWPGSAPPTRSGDDQRRTLEPGARRS